ncbi:MAG TPA: NAD-dependent epimerase/dehydratase family protein [Chitinophagaceae bacterium]|nr:NAD-dependent epimerase/dehydratase family protein [Chitinophagaceae bacterium]
MLNRFSGRYGLTSPSIKITCINPASKIFVTGGTGFLGAYIIRELLQKGYRVRAIRRRQQLPFFIPANVFDPVEWVSGDVLDNHVLENAMEDADAVVHCAAKLSFSGRDQREMYRTNIEGTANVVNAALLKKVPRFLHISSVAALGRTVNGETVNESKQWEDNATNTRYAISKYHAELEVWRGAGEGLNTVIVNPSTILGFGDWNNSSCALFKNAYNEFPWYSNGINGFVSVEDTARASVQLLESGIANERFIISAENWSFREVFNTMADAFGKKRPHREATALLAAIAWRTEKVKNLFSGKPSLLTKESARIAQTTTYFDNSKVCKALPGFSFTTLRTCIEEACQHYMQYV